MASIQKRGTNKHVAEVRVKGVYKSKTFTGKSSKLDATLWAADKEQELFKDGGTVRGKTLGDALERYAREVSPAKKGERWEVVRIGKLLRNDMAHVLLSDLKTDDINAFIAVSGKTIQPSSVNRELNLLSAVVECAKNQWHWIDHNPVRGAARPKNPAPRDKRINEITEQRILDALLYNPDEPVTCQRSVIAVAFLLALETAMRQGELWGLDWSLVNLEQQFCTLPDTKNGSKRHVALSSKAVALFKSLGPKESGRVFEYNQESCGVIFRRALQLAGIEGLTFHDTRHEALTRLARKIDVLDLARMVGHRDPRSLMIYYNATATEIAGRLG